MLRFNWWRKMPCWMRCWWYREPMWFDWKSDTYWCPNCEIRLERGNGWQRFGVSNEDGEVATYIEGRCPKCGAPTGGTTYQQAHDSLYPRPGRDYMPH